MNAAGNPGLARKKGEAWAAGRVRRILSGQARLKAQLRARKQAGSEEGMRATKSRSPWARRRNRDCKLSRERKIANF